jgi:hypothetical protein
MATQQAGLEHLSSTYDLLNSPLRLEHTEQQVTVWLPLFAAGSSPTGTARGAA